MAYDAKTERLISIKKLSGKAQTSNDKGLANEGLPSGLTVSSNTVFGQAITTSPSTAALYAITGQVELIRFPATFIAGSDTSDGRHGFELKLPSDYVSNSSNPNKGTYPFLNGQSINITSGSLQLIPPSYNTTYEAKPFYGGNATKNSGTQIPILDARDWYMDYFNGIMFQQDPPGAGDHSNNPDFVEAYLYIGKYLDDVNIETGVTRSKKSYKITNNISAGTNVSVGSSDMSTVNYDPNVIDLLLNGQMLLSGSASDLTAAAVDYSVTGATSIKFAFDIRVDDLITLTILKL